MADEVLKGDDDDLEIVEVEQLPAQQQQQAPVENEEPEAPEDDADDQDGHDDDSDEDERLGENAEESEKEITANQRKRQKRKEYLQRVRQKKDAEIEFLRAQNADFQRRMQALEGQAHTTLTNQLDQRIGTEQARVQQAELIMARALEAKNTADFVEAQNLRDEARDNLRNFQAERAKLDEPQQPQQPDPRAQQTATLAKQWQDANPWYDIKGSDKQSLITNAIDNALAREGYDPTKPDYWHELTRRVSEAIADEPAPQRRERPRREPAPTGNTREHAPPSTRQQVYVTPERKQAMIEAGYWEDPVKRAQMLRQYQAYDRDGAR